MVILSARIRKFSMTKTVLIVLMAHCVCLCAAQCSAPWDSTKAYSGGDAASFAGINYTANWWTKGDEPDTHSGPAGSGQPWLLRGPCGHVPPTPPPSPTPPPPPSPPPTPCPNVTHCGGLPPGVSGFYCLIADDTVTNYTSTSIWQPNFYPYQLTGTNVIFLTFVNPALLPNLPPAMVALGKCKGQTGCSPNGTPLIVSVGGEGYSNTAWPFLASIASAEAMAAEVATWSSTYGIDGIDLDIEGSAGSANNADVNLQAFATKLRSLNPGFIVTLPVYGFPQVATENYMVNNGFSNSSGSWKSTHLIDSVGIMVYQDLQALTYVKDYAEGTKQWSGFPIKVDVPTTNILAGIQGGAADAVVISMANAVVAQSLGGFMVWYASVFDATRGHAAIQYPGSDASVLKSGAWTTAVNLMKK